MAEGGNSKYGRLFTEADVEKMLRVQHDRSWSAATRDMDENAPAPSDEEYRPLTVEDAAGEADSLNQITGGLTFPPDEPLFLLRGQDKAAPVAIATYWEVCMGYGDPIREEECSEAHCDAVKAAGEAMEAWQAANPARVKIPD